MKSDDIFFDTDCISSFLWINEINIIEELYGVRIVIPGPVYDELCRPGVPHLKQRIDAFVENKQARIQYLEAMSDEYNLYKELTTNNDGKAIGRGEAAGIALAYKYGGILASNNYRDIAKYLKKYNLRHLDTGMVLTEALQKGLITIKDGDEIWQKMLAKNRKLPNSTFSKYLEQNKMAE